MDRPASSESMNVRIDGNVTGQVAIGDHILQIGEMHGGVVNFITPDKKPTFTARPRPVLLRPRAFRGLLDREAELRTASITIVAAEPLALEGSDGLGKTTLLRAIVHDAPTEGLSDGIVYCSARQRNAEDLLEFVFETFYESDSPAKPTGAELHRFLQNLKALILFDDVAADRTEVSDIINSLPECVCIFASVGRTLWGEGRTIQIEGLPAEEALRLVERELGKPISEHERAVAETFCKKVQGHPLYLIQGAALVRQGSTFAELGESVAKSADGIMRRTLAGLTDSQRQVLSVVAAAGLPIDRSHLAAICEIPDLDAQLAGLVDLHVLQANSPAFSLTGSLTPSLAATLDTAGAESQILNYFVRWIQGTPPAAAIVDVSDLLLRLIQSADRAGHWGDVISLGRGLESALVLGNRWQAWMQMLNLVWKAAGELGDRGIQAWALHELGTRSLCLGDLNPARESLAQALSIRQSLGDVAAAAVTQHNLDLIIPPPPVPPKPPQGGGSPPGPRMPAVLKVFLGLVGASIVIGAAILMLRPPTPPPPSPVPPSVTRLSPSPRPPSATKPPPSPASPTKPSSSIPAEPPTQTCRAGIWYCENFDDGIAQDFALDPGWSIESRALDGSGHSWATLTKHEWNDYRVAFSLTLIEGRVHLVYRLSSQDVIRRYFVGFEQHRLSLTKQVGDEFTELAAVDAEYLLNHPYSVEIAGWGGHLAVFVDRDLRLQYIDDTPLRDGTIAFETLDNSLAKIDDIEVGEPGDEVPPPDVQGPPPPFILEPKDYATVMCPGGTNALILRWQEPPDPSGIANYDIQVEISSNNEFYQKFMDVPDGTGPSPQFDAGGTIREVFSQCSMKNSSYFRWSVRARDGAGNLGQWAEWAYFRVVNDVPGPTAPVVQ
jgi:ABC-type dipeptide/oligopeptide/nickel transport system ATPase subunit